MTCRVLHQPRPQGFSSLVRDCQKEKRILGTRLVYSVSFEVQDVYFLSSSSGYVPQTVPFTIINEGPAKKELEINERASTED